MRALTLHRPWCWAIFDLPEGDAKRIENRRWRPPREIIGVPLAIHAGKTFDHEGAEHIAKTMGLAVPPRYAHPEGIVGVVTVVDVLDEGDLYTAQTLLDKLPGQERWFSGPFGWVLADVVRLAEPVPCRGMQGLWTLPREVLVEVAWQMGQIERRATGGR